MSNVTDLYPPYPTYAVDMSSRGVYEEDLFFSSPGLSSPVRRGPEDEVPILVGRASRVTTLCPAVNNFMVVHKTAFLSLFARQINLIRSRSQAFEDGHITVFDKTLLTLTQNGTDLDSPAAIQYYCEEFLGIHVGASTGEAGRVLSQAIDVPESLIQETAPQMTSDANLETDGHQPPAEEMEPQLKRLWEIYEIAKSDYFAVSNSKSHELLGAAKFLRDTAENTQQYLTDKNIDPNMLAELDSTYDMAKATVVSLSGGKKRKFDAVDKDLIEGAPRGPGSSNQNQRDRTQTNQYPSRSSGSGYGAGASAFRDNNADTDRDYGRTQHRSSRRRSSSPRDRRGRSPRSPRYGDGDRNPQPDRDRDQPGHRGAYSSKRGSERRRNPYGYRRDREVDSYQPRRYKEEMSD